MTMNDGCTSTSSNCTCTRRRNTASLAAMVSCRRAAGAPVLMFRPDNVSSLSASAVASVTISTRYSRSLMRTPTRVVPISCADAIAANTATNVAIAEISSALCVFASLRERVRVMVWNRYQRVGYEPAGAKVSDAQ